MLSVDDSRDGVTCPSDFNLADYVLHAGSAADDKIALSVLSLSGAERWSYGRLREEVRHVAGRLLAAGLEPGDRLLLRLGHTPYFPVAFLASAWCGIVPVPTSERLTEREVTAISNAMSPTAVLADEGIPLPESSARVFRADALPEAGTLPDANRGDPDRPGYCLITSGTSGQPRIVVHAHRAIWARHRMQRGWTDMRETDRVLHAGAFNWSYTLGTGLCDPWSIGATALVMARGTDLAALPLLAKRHDATIIAAVPGVYRHLLKAALPSLPKLRHALSAGEKLPESIRTAWRETTGTEIHEAFGQTECSTFLSGSPVRPAPPETLGFAQPGRAVAIVANGAPVPRGDSGEIAVSRDDAGLALSALTETGPWIGTGDLGIMNLDGSVSYLGRGDDVLTAGGYRISPIEIEQVYEGLPAVETAAAVDFEVTAGTRVVALHYTGPEPVDEALLREHGAALLAGYKVPRVFLHRSSLPRGANGKLLRAALRAEKHKAS